ncbi:hypothetical protein CLF_106870 [Clonorchis sinensis]|uniref:Uncharacterized protein n=1 Tax=Clonorchis sinensis TaxID=79923 RepID=G7YFV1_CLOSI|nr:hypothetical protein CLF_106870 [Clonorchis sinensis]
MDWAAAKEALAAEFDTATDRQEAMRRFKTARMAPGCDPTVFFASLQQSLDRALPGLDGASVFSNRQLRSEGLLPFTGSMRGNGNFLRTLHPGAEGSGDKNDNRDIDRPHIKWNVLTREDSKFIQKPISRRDNHPTNGTTIQATNHIQRPPLLDKTAQLNPRTPTHFDVPTTYNLPRLSTNGLQTNRQLREQKNDHLLKSYFSKQNIKIVFRSEQVNTFASQSCDWLYSSLRCVELQSSQNREYALLMSSVESETRDQCFLPFGVDSPE